METRLIVAYALIVLLGLAAALLIRLMLRRRHEERALRRGRGYRRHRT